MSPLALHNHPDLGTVVIVEPRHGHWPAIQSSWRGTAGKPGNPLYDHLHGDRTVRALARLFEPTHFRPNLFANLTSRLIDHLKVTAYWKVAAWGEDPAVLFGWICYAPNTLHYICVRPEYHHMGIAKLLLQAADLDPTAPACYTYRVADVKPPACWYYDPSLIFKHDRKEEVTGTIT